MDTPLSTPTDFCLRLARAYAVHGAPLRQRARQPPRDQLQRLPAAQPHRAPPGGRIRRVDLAERVSLTASGVTRTLLPLEKIGLVTRQSDPRDARVGFAVITPT
ncbi:MarR family transcriptional regulator [Massilia sp. H-1]|nr:MarR family transcriptional regulator [Massilia sp. H-1]